MINRIGQFCELYFDPLTEILLVKFGKPTTNDNIVKEVRSLLVEKPLNPHFHGELPSNQANFLNLLPEKPLTAHFHGAVLRVKGLESAPIAIAMLIAHEIGHLSKVVACYDPKLAKYIVGISHDPSHEVGSLIG